MYAPQCTAMRLSDQSVHENVVRIIPHVLIWSHHTGWCFLKAQMRHDTHALAQTMHIHATSIRIMHDDRSSKSRRADPLERPVRPNRGPMHPPQRARHGGCRRRGPCLQQWPQRHDNDRLAAAYRPVRRPMRLAAAAVVVGLHGGGDAAEAVVAPAGHVGQRTASMGGSRRRQAGRRAQIWTGSWRRGIRAQGAIMGRGEAPGRPTHLESRREGVRDRRDDGQVECRRRDHLQGSAKAAPVLTP